MIYRNIPFFLTDAGVNRNRWEVTLAKKLVKLRGTLSALDEDDDLIELKTVKKFVQFTILLRFTELDAVLLETV